MTTGSGGLQRHENADIFVSNQKEHFITISGGEPMLRLIIRKLSKCFLKTFQEEVRFVHAETQGRQQAEYVRAADTGKYMLFFQSFLR